MKPHGKKRWGHNSSKAILGAIYTYSDMANILQRAWTSAFNPWSSTFDITAPTVDIQTGIVSTPAVRNMIQLNQDSALSIGSVYRAVQIIGTAVCQMKPQVWRGTELIDSPSFIKRPDINMPMSHFIEMTVSSLAIAGNAYWLINRNAAGSINNIEVVNPNLVTIEVDDKTGKKRFAYNHKYYSPRDMQHLMLMRIPGYEYGVGPIQKVRGELEHALDLREYQGHWFTKSGMATGVLKTDQPLSNEWADLYKERWESVMTGVDRTAVLGNGLSYIPTYLNPKDAMAVESLNANLQQIARMFGIPASMLSLPIEGNSMTYSNTRDENSQFLRYTLSLYTNEIENAFSELLPRGQEVRFDAASLLKLNEVERFQNYSVAIDAGFMSVKEVREREGLVGDIPVKEVSNAPVQEVPADKASE